MESDLAKYDTAITMALTALRLPRYGTKKQIFDQLMNYCSESGLNITLDMDCELEDYIRPFSKPADVTLFEYLQHLILRIRLELDDLDENHDVA